MTTKKEQMARHIECLAKEYSITIISHSRGGRAWRVTRKVAIRPVKSEITYAVALHEIGHCLGKDQRKGRLCAEAGAWLWAKENADPKLWGKRATEEMKKSLGGYLKWAQSKHDRNVKNAPRIPDKGHYFWELLGDNVDASVSP